MNANKVAGFIVDDADGYITVNNMDAVTYQVAIPKPVQGEIDTDVGDNIEIAKSWENYISKKVSGNEGRLCSGVEKRGWQFES